MAYNDVSSAFVKQTESNKKHKKGQRMLQICFNWTSKNGTRQNDEVTLKISIEVVWTEKDEDKKKKNRTMMIFTRKVNLWTDQQRRN